MDTADKVLESLNIIIVKKYITHFTEFLPGGQQRPDCGPTTPPRSDFSPACLLKPVFPAEKFAEKLQDSFCQAQAQIRYLELYRNGKESEAKEYVLPNTNNAEVE